MNISKRLQKESKRTFWQTGSFRSGNQRQRKAWITQRYSELLSGANVNQFMVE